MSDRRLRELERAARAGDPQAQVAYWEEVRRADGFHDHGEQLDHHTFVNGWMLSRMRNLRIVPHQTAEVVPVDLFQSTNEGQGEIARLP